MNTMELDGIQIILLRCYEDLTQKGFSFSEIRKGRKPGTLVSTLNDPILGIPAILIGLDGEIS